MIFLLEIGIAWTRSRWQDAAQPRGQERQVMSQFAPAPQLIHV
jgi:hypothetical protein